MSSVASVKLSIRAFEFGTNDVANVLIRVVDNKNVVGIFRNNPVSIDLAPGNYGVYVSGDDYDTVLRGISLFEGQDKSLSIPVYAVGAMPKPPSSIREMRVSHDGADKKRLPTLLGVSEEKTSMKESVVDGPVFVDYRNPDGHIYTTKMNVENEASISATIGGVTLEVLSHCGNNTWREMGSPGKK